MTTLDQRMKLLENQLLEASKELAFSTTGPSKARAAAPSKPVGKASVKSVQFQDVGELDTNVTKKRGGRPGPGKTERYFSSIRNAERGKLRDSKNRKVEPKGRGHLARAQRARREAADFRALEKAKLITMHFDATPETIAQFRKELNKERKRKLKELEEKGLKPPPVKAQVEKHIHGIHMKKQKRPKRPPTAWIEHVRKHYIRHHRRNNNHTWKMSLEMAKESYSAPK
jgi:hypothetical protein